MENNLTIKSHCPKCGPNCNAHVRGKHQKNKTKVIDGENFAIQWSETYHILECAGCEQLFVEQTLWCSEGSNFYDQYGGCEVAYWPSAAKRQIPTWVDNNCDNRLREILNEVYSAINNELPILAAVGVRTAFDIATEMLNVDPHQSFEKKLEKLKTDGILSEQDCATLASLVNAGSAAVHRAWKPSAQSLSTLMDLLEGFIHKEFILKPQVSSLATSIPSRKKRTFTPKLV